MVTRTLCVVALAACREDPAAPPPSPPPPSAALDAPGSPDATSPVLGPIAPPDAAFDPGQYGYISGDDLGQLRRGGIVTLGRPQPLRRPSARCRIQVTLRSLQASEPVDDALRAAIRTPVERCYGDALYRDPALGGTLTLLLPVIDRRPVVQSSGQPLLAACLERELERVDLPVRTNNTMLHARLELSSRNCP